MKLLQAPVKTMLFYPPPYYKTLWSNREQNKKYWKEDTAKFIKQKYNMDITRQEFQ